MPRPFRIGLIAAVILAFAAISWSLAHVLSAASAERSAATDRIRARTRERVEILRVDHPDQMALGTRTTVLRIAWKTPTSLPSVQCAEVRRSGSPLTGFDVELIRLSEPIGREASCPKRVS